MVVGGGGQQRGGIGGGGHRRGGIWGGGAVLGDITLTHPIVLNILSILALDGRQQLNMQNCLFNLEIVG